ncbi:MAG: TolC family protein [Gammaproteobacteria bacterium]|jgi:cobalt-zinc-cadmium efflux system outer membrane protein
MRPWIIYLLLASLSTALSTALATGTQTHDRLTLEQAVVYVLERSPLLKSADYEAKAAAARIRTAKLTPAFKTSLEFENFGGNGTLSGIERLETTLSLSKVLELGDKASLRGDVAQNEAMLLRNRQDAERLDLLAETTKRFLQVIVDQERLGIAQESMALSQHTHDDVELRVKAGKSPDAELRRMKIALARQELKLDHARHVLKTTKVKLATLWGATQADFNSAEADLFDIEQPGPFETLVQLLERNPDLVQFATEKRLADTRIQLARSRNTANIEIAGGLRHFNFIDNTGLVMSLNIPLGSQSRAAPKIEEAELGSMRSTQDFQQRRLQLYATLYETYQELMHAINATTTLRQVIIPLAESSLRDYEKGYLAGRYSLLELNVAQQTLLDSRLEYVMAAADYHRYRIEIDRLTGAGLTAGVDL